MNDTPVIPPLAVPAKEAAQMLRIGRSTFWERVKKGDLPQPIRIGGSTRWRVSDLERYVQATQTTTP